MDTSTEHSNEILEIQGKESTRQWWAAALLTGALFGMIAFLTYIPIPEANANAINMVLGAILGASVIAQPKLFGDKKTEKLESQLKALRTEYTILKKEHDQLIAMLVKRHVVEGNGLRTE